MPPTNIVRTAAISSSTDRSSSVDDSSAPLLQCSATSRRARTSARDWTGVFQILCSTSLRALQTP